MSQRIGNILKSPREKYPTKICTHLYTTVIPVLGKQRQEDFSKLEVRLHSDSRLLSGSVKELML